MLIVYEHPLSPYAQKVKISLREKGIEFETRLPAGIGTGSTPDDFMKGNPRGEVPFLCDGDAAIFDSTIILEYIEDKWPTPPMLPASPLERARVRLIEDVMDCHYEPINWGLGELNNFKRATGELKDRIMARAGEQLAGLHAWLERELGDREWFNGDNFGWGDLSVVPYINGSAGSGFTPPREASSKLGTNGRWAGQASRRRRRKRSTAFPACRMSAARSKRGCSNANTATTVLNG